MEESSLVKKTNEKISFFRKNGSTKRIIVASFGVFLACLVILIPYNLISHSRPSADEFLLAALVNGYYVDYPTTDGVVFEQSGNFFIDAFSAVKSAVRMGWDSPLNFIIFNFTPALLLNIIGPVSTSIFSLLSQVLLVFCFFKITKFYTDIKSLRVKILFLIIGMFYISIITSNYGSDKTDFGVFALSGIRFSLYWIHPIITVLCFFLVVKKTVSNDVLKRRDLLVFILLPNLVSFWSISYWIVLLFILYLLTRKIVSSGSKKYLAKGICISTLFTVINLYPNLNPSVNANRLTIEKSNTSFELIQAGIEQILKFFLHASNYDTFHMLLSGPTLLGCLSGIFIVALCKNQLVISDKNFSYFNSAINKYFVKSMAFSVILLPILFSFLEFMTYKAWWHNTTPSTFLFLTFLFIGSRISFLLRNHIFKISRTIVLIIVLIYAALVPTSIRSINLLSTYSNSWDLGNLLSIGFPIENKSEYMVKNILKIGPHNLQNLDKLNLMSSTITYKIEFDLNNKKLIITASDSSFREFLKNQTVVVLNSQEYSFLDDFKIVTNDSSGLNSEIYKVSDGSSEVVIKVDISVKNVFSLLR
jgi:hypothetical protein